MPSPKMCPLQLSPAWLSPIGIQPYHMGKGMAIGLNVAGARNAVAAAAAALDPRRRLAGLWSAPPALFSSLIAR
jgi:hypothetical protein